MATTLPRLRLEQGRFTTLDPPGSIRSQGGFINAQGQVVGTYRDANDRRHGFIWSKGVFTTIRRRPAVTTRRWDRWPSGSMTRER